MPSVEVRIDDSGEIVVRSGSVIDGYFDDPEATRKALIDGWLHTGDAGYLEPNGHLVVLGRVSEVVRTAAGERYIPNYIENRIKFSPYVRNVAVLGAGRDELTAIVCIDLEAAGHWAEERGISFTSYADLSQKPEIAKLVASVLRSRQRNACRSRCASAASSICTRISTPTTARSPAPASCAATSSRSAMQALIDRALFRRRLPSVENTRITYESGETGTISRTLSICEVP